VKKTNELEGAANEKQRQLLVGETDNIHDVMIAMEKASLSLNLTLAVRNKVLDAYQEVMRMSI
jgi:flagellar hook-basal body complex protein FliE